LPEGPSFLTDHLGGERGLRLSTVRSYRDTLRLFLKFLAAAAGCKVSRLKLEHLTVERVLSFLRHIEEERGNHVRTRNQRLAALHTFFDYVGGKAPEIIAVSQRVLAIPVKRAAPSQTRFMEREDVGTVLKSSSGSRRLRRRDQTLLLFLYNTGARAQEAADLSIGDVDFRSTPRVQLHGKGDKWRMCPLWTETGRQLQELLKSYGTLQATDPVFRSQTGKRLTRFGIYKLVRRHTAILEEKGATGPHISPHIFRHSTAVHLLESGVDVNVIRGWLGHVSLETTNRYAEINLKAKEAALRRCEPPLESSEGFPRQPVWRNDEKLLNWLDSL
jgi:integrase/recombinase XerD